MLNVDGWKNNLIKPAHICKAVFRHFRVFCKRFILVPDTFVNYVRIPYPYPELLCDL